MRLRFLLAALVLLVLLPALAEARDVRFPESGAPSISFNIPDDWGTSIDSSGNMIITAADKSGAFALTIGNYSGDLDTLAAGAMKVAQAAPPAKSGADSISGYPGFDYESSTTNAKGVNAELHLVLVRVDPQHIVSATMSTANYASPDQRAALIAVMKSMVLSAQ